MGVIGGHCFFATWIGEHPYPCRNRKGSHYPVHICMCRRGGGGRRINSTLSSST